MVSSDLENNYIRDSGFINTLLPFWSNIGGFVSWSVVARGAPYFNNQFRGVTNSATATIDYNDCISVDSNNVIEYSIDMSGTTGISPSIFVTFLNSAFHPVQQKEIQMSSIPTSAGFYGCKFIIPNYTSYITFRQFFTGTIGTTVQFTEPTLQVKTISCLDSALPPLYSYLSQSTSTLIPNATHDTIISPLNENTIVKINNMSLSAYGNPTATTGTISIWFLQDNGNIQIIYLDRPYNGQIVYQFNDGVSWTTTRYPNDRVAMVKAIENIIITKEMPLTVRFANNTNTNYSQLRDFRFVLKQELIG